MNTKLTVWLSLCGIMLLLFLILFRLQKPFPVEVKNKIKYEKFVQKKAKEFKEVMRPQIKSHETVPWEQQTTIIVKTLFRPSCLLRLLKSIRKYYHSVPIIIVDDSTAPLLKDGDADDNITYKYLPFDSGASLGRNTAVNLAKTEYILLVDDDFTFNDGTDIEKLYNFLSKNKEFDVVCGGVSDRGLFTGLFYKTKDGYDVKCNPKNPIGGELFYTKKIDSDFYETHRGVNFFLARKQLLLDVPWDNDMKTNEHTEHFFRMFLKGKKIAVTPSVIAGHDGGKYCNDNFDYMVLRGRNFINFVYLKHNITSFCGVNMTNKQKKFHTVLKDFVSLLKDYPLQITCGTALGFHREGGFIEHDEDLDFALPEKSVDSVEKIVKLLSSKFDVFALREKELSFVHKTEKVRVDIFYLYDGNKHKWYCTYGGKKYDKEIQWKLPNYEPETIQIFGQTYNIIPKWVLPFIYGGNWGVPKKYSYNDYLHDPTGIYRLDDTPMPVPTDTFVNDFFQNAIYVINLDSRPDKMKKADEILKKIGIKFKRFPAKVGLSICNNKNKRQLTAGEVGCLWSHTSIWKNALENNIPWTLIFEDDPYIPENITQKDFGDIMLEASVGNRDPQFILFGHCFSEGIILPTIHNKIFLKEGGAQCTHCYAISLEAIKQLLPEMQKRLCTNPIDKISSLYYKNRKGMYAAYPLKKITDSNSAYGEGIILQERAFVSDIADRTTDKTKGKSVD